jgi:diguanylate cyclase (GGDEF)-like protein
MRRESVQRRLAVDTGFHPDRLNMGFAAQVAAFMYLGAAVASLLLCFAPSAVAGQRPLDLLLFVASLVGAVVWFVVFDRAPLWLLYGGTCFGTVIISAGAFLANATGQGVALYIWGVIYAFVFFRRRVAGLYLAAVCASDAVVLRLADSGDTWPSLWVLASLTLVAVGCVVGALRDRLALELRRSEEQARTDELTGLPNRRALIEDLEAALASGVPHRLVLCDLNGFKSYNDTLGHHEGDRLLERVAARLQRCAVGRGRGYRLGGDEFCALWPASADLTVAGIEWALRDHAEAVAITAALGVVDLPGEADHADGALRIADARMYDDKRSAPRPARAA